jgi:hypothetical protein
MNIKIINNFLFKEDFTELSQLILKKTKEKEINVYHNSISMDGIKINECIEKNTLIRLHKNYHNRAIQLLTELSPKKVELYEYSEFHIIETGKNYKFPIHDDTPNKLLSGVIYLTPINNVGTLFYDNKSGDNKREIKWEQNRAVFFSRKEKKTWHSYRGDGTSNRIALVYNLMTKNIKEVSKIENNNYYFSMFRYKLNPSLYRLFGITI